VQKGSAYTQDQYNNIVLAHLSELWARPGRSRRCGLMVGSSTKEEREKKRKNNEKEKK
jgi:hypothetical protein